MNRYVRMNLLEDHFDEEGNRVDQVQPWIEKLSYQAVTDPNLLERELDWLVTTKAGNGFRFGYALGIQDKQNSLLNTLLSAQRKTGEEGSDFFLGGYLRSIFELDSPQWELAFDRLAEDEQLRYLVPDLTWRSGMSDRAALRILRLAEMGQFNIISFQVFALGSSIRDISEDIFHNWITFLLESTDSRAVFIALDLYHFYYLSTQKMSELPEELTIQLLLHPVLFQEKKPRTGNHMDDGSGYMVTDGDHAVL